MILAEIKINPVHVAYAVMIIGVMFTFLFYQRQKKDLRTVAADFVFPFVKLSNFICPKQPKNHLLTEELPDGSIRALPPEQQSGEIRAILARANEDTSVKLFSDLVDASDEMSSKAGFNRTDKVQFAEPIREMLLLTHNFLQCCEDLSRLDSKEKLEQFESYLYEQPKHRMLLIKRIPGAMAEEYRQLNTAYTEEMEEIERAEYEAAKHPLEKEKAERKARAEEKAAKRQEKEKKKEADRQQ